MKNSLVTSWRMTSKLGLSSRSWRRGHEPRVSRCRPSAAARASARRARRRAAREEAHLDVGLLRGEEVVERDDVVALVDEAAAQVRSEEAAAARHQDAEEGVLLLLGRHAESRRWVHHLRCCTDRRTSDSVVNLRPRAALRTD
eukprot:1060948-Prymnesium_polylepis.1